MTSTNAAPDDSAPTVLIRRPTVLHQTGFSKTALDEAIKRGDFPPPIKLTERSVAWVQVEVQGWIESRIRAARQAA